MQENSKDSLDQVNKSILKNLKVMDSKEYSGSKWGPSAHSIYSKIKDKSK